MRCRDYPGWQMVWALAATETVSYGILCFSFAAFLLLMQQSLGFSQATLTGAFSLSILITGVGAVPAGVWLDRYGAQALMSAGPCWQPPAWWHGRGQIAFRPSTWHSRA
jgi:hypothetical protein